ncbi:MAG: AHH domain-containing protein [Opitutaceae bacterium]|nr:AHH domain-containing protein [Opitutaceae bacterium]
MRELTDEAGAITATYTYDAFGVLPGTTSTSTQDLNPYRYCGEQWDFDLSLYFNRARYLNPNSGRFWSMDTYEGAPSDPTSLHKYLYANSSPLSFIDPSGYFSLGELSMVQNVQSRLNQMAIPNVRVIGQKVVKKLVCITAQGVIREGPIHHIATNKNFKAGKQFSKKFSDLFEEAGINLNHWANRLGVPGHKGPHPEACHDEILKMLTDGLSSVSVEGLAAEAAREVLQEALQNALLKVAGRLCNANDPLTRLIAP